MSESENKAGDDLADDMEITEEEGENVKGGRFLHRRLTHHEMIMKHRDEKKR